jgi:site-specific recombinase XerD
MVASKITSALEAMLANLGSDHSRRGYRADWSQFVFWLKYGNDRISVFKATTQDVERYLVHLANAGKAKGTRARHLSVIRAVYREIVAQGIRKWNPAREARNI